MVIREELVATPESGTAAANLDLDDDSSEGRHTAVIPQLIKEFDAIAGEQLDVEIEV